MNNVKSYRIRENLFYTIIYQMISLLIPVITTPYISRVIGVDGIGLYSYTQSIVMYFCLIATIGLGTHGQRGIAISRGNIESMTICFFEIVILRTITTIIGGALFLLYTSFINDLLQFIFLIQIIDILAAPLDIAWFFQGIENFKKVTIRQCIIKLMGVVCIFLFVKKPEDLYLYILGHSVPVLIGNILLWPGIKQNFVRVRLADLHPLIHLKSGIALFFPYMATLLFSNIDKTVLGILVKSNMESGYYAQAMRFINLGTTVLSMVATAIIPRISNYYQNNKKKEISKLSIKAIQLICLISCLFIGVLISVARNLIPWFLGTDYDKTVYLLQILCIVIFFKGLNNYLGGAILIGTFHQGKYSMCIWVSMTCNFLLNVVLVSRYKAIGACVATVIAEIVLFSMLLYFSKEFINIREMLHKVWKYMAAAFGAATVITIIQKDWMSSIINSFILIVLFGLFYLIFLVLLKEQLIKETGHSLLRSRNLQ